MRSPHVSATLRTYATHAPKEAVGDLACTSRSCACGVLWPLSDNKRAFPDNKRALVAACCGLTRSCCGVLSPLPDPEVRAGLLSYKSAACASRAASTVSRAARQGLFKDICDKFIIYTSAACASRAAPAASAARQCVSAAACWCIFKGTCSTYSRTQHLLHLQHSSASAACRRRFKHACDTCAKEAVGGRHSKKKNGDLYSPPAPLV